MNRMSEYRNPRLLALAKDAPRCFCCGRENDNTVVSAHSNEQAMGKGMGHKASDIPAFVCATCHDLIDGRNGGWSREAKIQEWRRAALLSMRWALVNHPEVFR